MSQVKVRNHLLDTIKGVAIILVVFGHCIQLGCGAEYIEQKAYWDNTIFQIIYSFHMPLFALVSGYLMYPSLQRYAFGEYAKKQFLNIGIPLLLWSIIAFSISLVKNGVGGAILYKSYFNLLMGNLWFLRVLLVDSLLIAFVTTIFKSMCSRVIAFSTILIITLFMPDIFHYNRAVYLLPYIVIGYVGYPYLKNHEKKKLPWWVIILSITIFAVLMIGFKSEYIYSYPHAQTYLLAQGSSLQSIVHQLYVDGYRWLIGFAGCAMVVLVFCKLVQNTRNIVSEIGKLSLAIYILSVMIYQEFLVLLTGSVSYNILLISLETVIIIALCVITAKILCINKFVGRAFLGNTNFPFNLRKSSI